MKTAKSIDTEEAERIRREAIADQRLRRLEELAEKDYTITELAIRFAFAVGATIASNPTHQIEAVFGPFASPENLASWLHQKTRCNGD